MCRILSPLLTFGMLCAKAPLAEADNVTFGWDPNTDPDLAGYRLYYGNSPRSQGTYTQTVPINNKSATTWVISLQAGISYFALTAVDLSGNESGDQTFQDIREALFDSVFQPMLQIRKATAIVSTFAFNNGGRPRQALSDVQNRGQAREVRKADVLPSTLCISLYPIFALECLALILL